MAENDCGAKNTDREIWREREGDYYADSIHVTEVGGIGINCGGFVVVLPIREWHALAKAQSQGDDHENEELAKSGPRRCEQGG